MMELEQSPVRSTQIGDQTRNCNGLIRRCLSRCEEAMMTCYSALAGAQHSPELPTVIAGVGCSSAASGAEIVALVEACLAEAGLTRLSLAGLASHERRHGHSGLAEAAEMLDVSVRFVAEAMPVSEGANSAVALALNLAGVAESAAQSAGPLLLPKRKSAHATCALGWVQPAVSVARAASTLSASAAGP